MRVLLLLLVVGCLLPACGLKGPLYIPTPEQLQEQAERERLLKEREQREKGEAPPPQPATPAPPARASAVPGTVLPTQSSPDAAQPAAPGVPDESR